MYSPILSLLLMGFLPFHGGTSSGESPLERVHIAPPALTASTSLGQLSASGVLIIDRESGQPLFAKEARIPRPMASLTKIMTALLIVEHHAMEEWITIPPEVRGVGGESIHLEPGQQFTVGDLLSAMLIGSANDAAVTLALYHSGSMEVFVDAMNVRARELGLRNTSYQNPVGFDAEMQWSTPQDIAWLVMFALRSEEIRRRMGLRGATFKSRSGDAVTVTHTHALLHAENGVIAGKTGTTPEARQCLLSVVKGSDDREYIVVLLRSLNRYADMRAIVRVLAS
ncbi:D-alanyl-D-alanine carboxypeptidase [Candidatus Peregrinibacteria bacterium]|nr:D-alanyl-D-alanine carboxypeptidase [Candidatus Peregrinibacteria bacterium]